jgi:hypothetical protein
MKLYCPEPLAQVPVHPLFFFKFPERETARGYFNENLPPNYFEHEVEWVPIEDAAAVVVPNNFVRVTDASRAYIKQIADEAERLSKPVFVFSHADLSDRVRFDPRVYVFRYSVYRHTKGPRDIMTPTLVEDLGTGGITLRTKVPVPVVSFCGKAGYPSVMQWLNYLGKTAYYHMLGVWQPYARARKVGVYWRRATMRACAGSTLIKTSFIVRQGFSGHPRSADKDPESLRKEFVDSVVGADFVLAPKGDGNYSNRFQETLSLGRIPVYIETDSCLPLEKVADYNRVIVRVPMERVGETPRYIREFYDSLGEEEYAKLQRLARETFEQYVRPDAFYRYIFTQALPNGTLTSLS